MNYALPPVADLSRGPAATPIAFIRAIVTGYRRRGVDPSRALAHARIPAASLANPNEHVTAAQMELMSAMAMQELDDEALGWFARRLPWGSYGMLCRASLTSPDLGVALKRWCRHHRLLTEEILLSLHTTRSTATLRIDERSELGELREFCLVSSLRYVLGYASWAIDSHIALSSVEFPFGRPAHGAVYPLIFPGEVLFDAQRAELSFDARYLAFPLRRDERDLRLMLQRALLLTVRQYTRDRLLVQRVRRELRMQIDRPMTAESLAERLNVSPRTLHRHLNEEGATLQELKDEARRNHAIDLLNRTGRSIKQVAQATGFRNEKSFSRAFRQWTGKSPNAFRDEANAGPSNG